MSEEMRPRDLYYAERDMRIEMSDTPCMQCPHRNDSYCNFYRSELEEITPGIFIPCGECEDDMSDE